MVIAERMNTFENKMTREFGAKVKIVMEEQYHNREKNKSPRGNDSETKE